MEVTQDLSFVHLISNASVLVQLVMGLLLLVSMMSWWYIFLKLFAIRRETRL
ncbi:MAG: protein TolQ, partial [Gallionella sp.]|nr:protein TolQ [Gallionella sp.]